MPQASNFTVKNSANADVVFKLRAPAAGDGIDTIWQNTDGLTAVQFPEVRYKARANASGTARTSQLLFTVPYSYVDSVTGLPVKVSNTLAKVEFVAPGNYPIANFADVLQLLRNILAVPQIVAAMEDQNQPLT